jgi:hypothetical protein
MTTDPQTARFRHRTTEVEAVQWTGSNADQLRAFCGRDFDGMDPMEPGDWVVKADEDFLVFSPVDFATYYEPAPAVAAPAETALRDRIAAAVDEGFRLVAELEDANLGDSITSSVLAVLPERSSASPESEVAHSGQPASDLNTAPVPADRPAEEAYRLAVSAALRLGTGATWEVIRDRAEDLVAEVAELTEARRRGLDRQQAIAATSTCTCGRTPDPGICPLEHDGYKAGGHCTCAHPPVGRDESHRLAERQIRDAARGLFFDVGARVIAVLDDDARRLAIRARQCSSGSVELPDPKFKENAESLNGAIETPVCPDPIECGHEAALGQARATNRRLNLRAQGLESELAAYRRAVGQWEVSKRGTYVPLRTIAAIAKAAGRDIETPQWLLHYQRVEQAEAAIERVRRLHDSLEQETDLSEPDDLITKGSAARRIATALDGWSPALLPSCDVEFVGGGHCAKPAGHRPPGSDDPHVPAVVPAGAGEEPADETVHGCPPDGSGLTPCCGRTPFELPRTDRMTRDAALVTCAGPAGGAQQPKEAEPSAEECLCDPDRCHASCPACAAVSQPGKEH